MHESHIHQTSSSLTCAITGASSGIGLAAAVALARHGVRVVVVCRPSPRAKAAFSRLQSEARVAPVMIAADLSLAKQARAAAEAIGEACPSLDVLIHNAGVWPMQKQLTEEGFETAFAVNHLAPFVMNQVLLPRLQATPGARIVQVTAGLYGKGHVDLHRTPKGEDFHRLKTYANTKLWNLLASTHLAQSLEGQVTVNAVHPGVVRTRLGASASLLGGLLWLVKRFWLTPEAGARGPVHLALSPELSGISGQLYNQLQVMAPLPVLEDVALRNQVVATTQRIAQSVSNPA